jgi:hypothetical protein
MTVVFIIIVNFHPISSSNEFLIISGTVMAAPIYFKTLSGFVILSDWSQETTSSNYIAFFVQHYGDRGN